MLDKCIVQTIPGSANVFDIPNKEIALSYFDAMVTGFLFTASNLLLVNRYISLENKQNVSVLAYLGNLD